MHAKAFNEIAATLYFVRQITQTYHNETTNLDVANNILPIHRGPLFDETALNRFA